VSSVTVTMTTSRTTVTQSAQPRLTIRDLLAKTTLVVPFAPVEATRDGHAAVYQRTPRPGRSDSIARQYEATDTLAFQLFLAYRRPPSYDPVASGPDYAQTVEPVIAALDQLASQTDVVMLDGYAPAELGPWYITSLSHNVTDRVPGTNEASRCTSSITFTRATAASVVHGPLAIRVNNGYGKTLVIPVHSTYTVKRGKLRLLYPNHKYYSASGQNLGAICMYVYGNPFAWKFLAHVNHIRHPKRQLRVGLRLKTPPWVESWPK
jgi:hypothetical protein